MASDDLWIPLTKYHFYLPRPLVPFLNVQRTSVCVGCEYCSDVVDGCAQYAAQVINELSRDEDALPEDSLSPDAFFGICPLICFCVW